MYCDAQIYYVKGLVGTLFLTSLSGHEKSAPLNLDINICTRGAKPMPCSAAEVRASFPDSHDVCVAEK